MTLQPGSKIKVKAISITERRLEARHGNPVRGIKGEFYEPKGGILHVVTLDTDGIERARTITVSEERARDARVNLAMHREII